MVPPENSTRRGRGGAEERSSQVGRRELRSRHHRGGGRQACLKLSGAERRDCDKKGRERAWKEVAVSDVPVEADDVLWCYCQCKLLSYGVTGLTTCLTACACRWVMPNATKPRHNLLQNHQPLQLARPYLSPSTSSQRPPIIPRNSPLRYLRATPSHVRNPKMLMPPKSSTAVDTAVFTGYLATLEVNLRWPGIHRRSSAWTDWHLTCCESERHLTTLELACTSNTHFIFPFYSHTQAWTSTAEK